MYFVYMIKEVFLQGCDASSIKNQLLSPPKVHPPGDSMVSESAKPKAAHATTCEMDDVFRWWIFDPSTLYEIDDLKNKTWLKLQSNTQKVT